MFGPAPRPEGQPFDRQVVQSAFELDAWAVLRAGRRTTLTGRSWSAAGPIRHVEVSTDGGTSWRRARATGPSGGPWQRWEIGWTPAAGAHELMARATDVRGNTQPDVARYNTLGYLFDAVVRLPVTAA
ncbi:hypothetical protein ACFQS1_12950 [Paractinoplanes rhizophilus]|uniref:Moybdenum cofactor oxidoreductase dimerisation domain-containing protein n=1 Tax=Paractinoplanes rhizophilus TaxID=1416877 RepID=A0ABW2HP78_9ACTN